MPQAITHLSFESILGQTVELKSAAACFNARVENVTLLRQNPGQARQPFSVELLADDFDDHGQQIYELSHPDIGKASLFAVPLGAEKNGMRYQIVFN